jgi:hypothetical protein
MPLEFVDFANLRAIVSTTDAWIKSGSGGVSAPMLSHCRNPHLNSLAVEAERRERTSSERLRLLAGLARREYRLDSE